MEYLRVACTLVVEDGKILLVKEYKGWNFVTEHAKDEENESVLHAAWRGVKEEAGYFVSITGCLGIIDTTYRSEGATVAVFVANLKHRERVAHEPGIETAQFMSVEEIRAIPREAWRFPDFAEMALERLESGVVYPLEVFVVIPRI